MIGNLGFPEIVVILVIVLLLFGAKRIPEIAGSLGKGIREFRRSVNEATREVTDAGSTTDRLSPPPPEAEPRKGEPEREPKRLVK